MISFDTLPGNAALKASLQNALSGRFPQTVLLSGDDSAGLEALSIVLAAGILCESPGKRPCGTCLACRKAEQGVHPDLTVIDEGENELKVDLARRIKAENAIVPNDGARRVTVIRHAQNLNPMAQNALLKELEEPPSHAFFILTAEQPDALLQTVRSRCAKFTLEPPRQTVSNEDAAALLAPYLAALAERREDRMMLAALALEKPQRRTLLGILGVLQAALRDAVFAAKALPQAPLQPALRRQTAVLARAVSADRLLTAYDFVEELIDRVSRNAAAAAVTCALTSDVYRICFL
ncbi:MAG TPA: hypothetical protein H9835_09455 [Candidatus Agathobaculum merdigallinarum]|nr:hypothetical protein [Candidatus Agathobaculum merdigallinarum]